MNYGADTGANPVNTPVTTGLGKAMSSQPVKLMGRALGALSVSNAIQSGADAAKGGKFATASISLSEKYLMGVVKKRLFTNKLAEELIHETTSPEITTDIQPQPPHEPGWHRWANLGSYGAMAAAQIPSIHKNDALTKGLYAAGTLGLGLTAADKVRRGDPMSMYDVAGLSMMGAGLTQPANHHAYGGNGAHAPGWHSALNAASYGAFMLPYMSDTIHDNKALTTGLNAAGLLGLSAVAGHASLQGDHSSRTDLLGLGTMGLGMAHQHLRDHPEILRRQVPDALGVPTEQPNLP